MITIESINGKLYTVVWYVTPLTCGTLGKRFSLLNDGCLAVFGEAECMSHIATALPALPRYPKPEDARLLHQYAAYGLKVCNERGNGFVGYSSSGYVSDGGYYCFDNSPITHATFNGERVEVAIEG